MMVHAAVIAAALVMPPDATTEAEVAPAAVPPPVSSLPDSVWSALLEREVVVRLSTGEVIQGKLLVCEGSDIVLADATGVVMAHPKATIVEVRLEADVAEDLPAPEIDVAEVPVAVETPIRPTTLADAAAPRRLQWTGIGVLLAGVATGSVGAWLWTSGYSSYVDAREAYYGPNGTCNNHWDPCGSRIDYDAAKRAADIRIEAGIATVAVGSAFVAAGVVMAIVGGVRASKARRRGTVGARPMGRPLGSLLYLRF